ncbi:MAG: hypothetical protein JNL90_01245 [Planctomycetes bacterium]|nr:hypothetical protein [Planctomycetota bacterium]
MNEGIDKRGLAVVRSSDGGVVVWTRPETAAAAAALRLLDGVALAQLEGAQATTLFGRGAPLRLPFAGRSALAKELRRGGLAGRWRGDSFAGPRRLEELLDVQLALEAAGVAVAPFAFARARRTPSGFRLEFATFELHEARDAAALLPTVADSDERRALQSAAGAVVASLHRAGCRHADLNAKNVLLARAPPRAWLIDFDRSRVESAPIEATAAAANLARLLRSAEKLALLAPAGALAPRDLAAFVRAYVAARGGGWRRAKLWRAVAALHRRSIGWHRLGWRLFGRGKAADARAATKG